MTSFREYRERPSADPIEVIHANHVLPPAARDFQGQRAGFVSRAIAASIDVSLIFATVLLTAAALWMLSFIIDPTTAAEGSDGRVPELVYMVVYGYFLNWAYWTVCWALSGRTIGNLVMGVRVVNRKGSRLGWGPAAVRSAFCALFPVGLLWVVVSGANRSVQDVVQRTSVIYDWVVGLPTLKRVLGRVPYVPEDSAH
ncbi:MAG: RDD family protein [Actinomycetota bacterium]|nr:RDD family protein [Actinomycetota bacterium]